MQTKPDINILTVCVKIQPHRWDLVCVCGFWRLQWKSFSCSGRELSGGVHSIPTGVHLTHHIQGRALYVSVQEGVKKNGKLNLLFSSFFRTCVFVDGLLSVQVLFQKPRLDYLSSLHWKYRFVKKANSEGRADCTECGPSSRKGSWDGHFITANLSAQSKEKNTHIN